MARLISVVLVLVFGSAALAQEVRRLPLKAYRDKMMAGWVGQMAGVGWGGPTEFHYQGRIMPADKLPKWEPKMINQFGQDDLYVEMTFLRTLELYGLDCTMEQAGIDFANSEYELWHANKAGRDNLRKGIAPPDSGHPAFNAHADDIDYQIEADFAGLIAPGLPNTAIALGEKFGHLMNYGDGVYGGQFVAALYSYAFFEDDPRTIVERALACIPAQSQYAKCVRDVLELHRRYSDDFTRTWEEVNRKYHLDADCRRSSCSKGEFNIDAKINGAYVVIGLLYGGRDPERTICIATRCGQDSDCNPSNAAGVLFTTIGYSNLPEKFTSALDRRSTFSHTPYDFPKLVAASEQLAKQAVLEAGGRIERDEMGQEVLVIPVQAPMPSRLEQCWSPDSPRGVKFTAEQMRMIRGGGR